MRERLIRKAIQAAVVFIGAALFVFPLFAEAQSRVVDREIQSKNFTQNRIGTSAVRKLVVYLPAGYDGAGSDGAKRYPVIYFLPNPLGGYRDLFDKNGAQELFDRAVAGHAIGGV